MSALNFAVLMAAITVAVISTILVFHKEYEDGLIGRFALSLMALAGIGRAVGILESDFEFRVTPQGAMIWLGAALFLGRHFYRFLRWRNNGDYEWRDADK